MWLLTALLSVVSPTGDGQVARKGVRRRRNFPLLSIPDRADVGHFFMALKPDLFRPVVDSLVEIGDQIGIPFDLTPLGRR